MARPTGIEGDRTHQGYYEHEARRIRGSFSRPRSPHIGKRVALADRCPSVTLDATNFLTFKTSLKVRLGWSNVGKEGWS